MADQKDDTPRFGPDRLTIEEVMHMPKARFEQWVQQLKAKEKSELIVEMFVHNLNTRAGKNVGN